MPAAQILTAAFWGWRAALGLGAACSALAIWLCVGPPPEVRQQDALWSMTLTSPSQLARSTIVPPSPSRAAATLTAGGRAVLFVCATAGEVADLDVRLGATLLDPVVAPAQGTCWRTFAVPAAAVTRVRGPLEATASTRGRPVEVAGGYMRPRERGGRSGGGALFDGQQWRTDDLSPSVPGDQVGRYFIELRVFDAAGRLVELWF